MKKMAYKKEQYQSIEYCPKCNNRLKTQFLRDCDLIVEMLAKCDKCKSTFRIVYSFAYWIDETEKNKEDRKYG